ncbi:hypothetical protein CEXT_519951 [Caerostris extrusa]|uniref:Uncharacterized protein n=1 Tax=Caerostris extrusa TaxID=172846 RepID=A0AAV4X859_CAEEX|nr:hypothetical protein CEXT_519951 [Caerostris extrusa]
MCHPPNCARNYPPLFESGYSRHCAAGGNLLLSKQSPAMTATFVSFSNRKSYHANLRFPSGARIIRRLVGLRFPRTCFWI